MVLSLAAPWRAPRTLFKNTPWPESQLRFRFRCLGAGPRLLVDACQWTVVCGQFDNDTISSSKARLWTQDDKHLKKCDLCWHLYSPRAMKQRKKSRHKGRGSWEGDMKTHQSYGVTSRESTNVSIRREMRTRGPWGLQRDKETTLWGGTGPEKWHGQPPSAVSLCPTSHPP